MPPTDLFLSHPRMHACVARLGVSQHKHLLPLAVSSQVWSQQLDLLMRQALHSSLHSAEVLAVSPWPDTKLHQQQIPKRAHVREAIHRLLEVFIPRSHTRTNLHTTTEEVPRAVTLGSCTQFHIGITQASYKYDSLLEWIHALANVRRGKMNVPYLAASLSETPSPIHADRNFGLSCTISFGEFSGGQLRLFADWHAGESEHKTVSTHGTWTWFDSTLPHLVLPCTGRRM
eukprot:5991705-Amphidinium_carterae.1